MAHHRTVLAILVVATLALAACGSSDDGGDDPAVDDERGPGAGTRDDGAEPVVRPEGPAADLTGRLEGGGGVLIATADAGPDLDGAGWVEEELAAAGTATSYRSEDELPGDGRFDLVEDASADYRTRIVVRRPADPDAFSGTVVVEWFNVSGGFDAGPDYSYLAEELLRRGHAWVGVSAQHIGIEGGPVAVTTGAGEGLAGRGLRALDPERYGSLSHPGDAFSYDIFTQVARALRQPRGALGELEVDRLLAIGESQSGFALTTYANGVQPLTRQFDGFLIHSRGSGAAPLGEAGAGIDIAGAIGGPPTLIRDDLTEPVLVVESEGDLLSIINYFPARQPDTPTFRLWEAAGTAHADRFLIGPLADDVGCPAPVNDGPQRFVVRAALRALDQWVRTGEAPPEAERIEVDATPAIVRDADGNAVGGIRTPHVEVPVATLSGDPSGTSPVICLLVGSTVPLPDGRLAELYAGRQAYLDAYADAADAAVEAGFVLHDDLEEVLADAEPDRIPG